MSKLWIIIKEVYRKNVKSGAFVTMVLGPIVMFGLIGLISYFIANSRAENSVGQIGVVGATPEIVALLDSNDVGNSYHYYDRTQDADKDLASDTIDGYFAFDSAQAPMAVNYYRKTTSKDIDPSVVTTLLQSYQTNESLLSRGVDPSVVAAVNNERLIVETINLTFDEAGNQTDADADSEKRMIRTGIAYVVSFVVYLFIMTYVGIISQEIATEKGSRIMEIILSSVSANYHFFGKLLGIFLVILTQLAIYLVLFIIARFGFNAFDFNLPFEVGDILSQARTDILYGLLFGFMGILIYSALSAFLGSLVSKTEDVGKMTMPLVLLGIVGFYIGMYALSSTNNAIVRIGSHVPFFTPFVMPFRLAAGTVATNEVYLAVALSLVFVVISLWISSVFYKSNILVTSDKGLIKTFQRSYALWRSEKQG